MSNKTDKTIDALVGYVEDESITNRFAIALYGEWGSGKTYFLEHRLRPALEQCDYRMLRISLFGVSSSGEAYERLLASYFRLEGSRARKFGRDLAGTAWASALALLGKRGLYLAVSAESVLSLMKMDKCLVVLDDTERSGMTADAKGLFGLVNEMVENLHWHVLLVRNEPFGLSDESESTQAEKVVSRQIEYSPALEELYEFVILPELGSYPQLGFDVDQAIMTGIRASGHINVRSIARSIPVLKSVLECEAMQPGTYASEGRRHALADIARFTVTANAGAGLKSPKEVKGSSHRDSTLERMLILNDYMKQEALGDIVMPLYKGQTPPSSTVGKCVALYLSNHYPDSPADAEMGELFDKARNILSMDDDEAARLSKRLASAISRHEFGPQWIVNAWAMNGTMYDLGFPEALSDEQVRSSMEALVESIPVPAYERLEKEKAILSEEDAENGRRAFVESLLRCAKDVLTKRNVYKKGVPEGGWVGPQTGLELVRVLRAIVNSPLPSFESIDTKDVALCFASGDGVTQGEIRQFFHEELPTKIDAFEDKAALRQWLCELVAQVQEIEQSSRMGMARKDRLVGDLRQLVESLSQ